MSTFVILLFLVHPQITHYMVEMFNCKVYDEEYRLEMDLQIKCYEHKHKMYSFGLAIPCFLIWGLGIPAMIYVLMYKDRENLDTDAVNIKFGFLFNGYKRENFTWEIIIMYRKTVALCLSVFLSNIGLKYESDQALILLILLVLYLSLNGEKRPFAERTLNEIENISLAVQIITIYCGLFFISRTDQLSGSSKETEDSNAMKVQDEGAQLPFLVIIAFVNILFFFVWSFKFLLAMRTMIKQNYQRTYIIFFLCCRKDKLEKDEAKLARDAKRETIIEKIEDIQFFIKNMKTIYSKEIFYEGHEKFIELMYYIESQKNDIDLTVKRHNLYIQGNMARPRKFNPEKMKEKKN